MNYLTTVPLRLKRVGQDTWAQMTESQLMLTASSLAYITILSIIPLLAMSFAIFSAFGGSQKLLAVVQPFILDNLAEGADEDALKMIGGFINNVHTSTVGIGGLIGLIATCFSMLSNIENAFNRIWQARRTRSHFQRFATYWVFITLGPLALSIAIGVISSLQVPLKSVFPGANLLFLILVAALYATYKYVPNCWVKPKFALIAAVFTSGLFEATRLLYNLYISHFATYNKIYGSLAAIPILLLWIFIVWVILLTGAALNAALQKRLEPRGAPTPTDDTPGAPA